MPACKWAQMSMLWVCTRCMIEPMWGVLPRPAWSSLPSSFPEHTGVFLMHTHTRRAPPLPPPAALHFCFTPNHTDGKADVAQKLVDGLREGVATLTANPDAVQGGTAPMWVGGPDPCAPRSAAAQPSLPPCPSLFPWPCLARRLPLTPPARMVDARARVWQATPAPSPFGVLVPPALPALLMHAQIWHGECGVLIPAVPAHKMHAQVRHGKRGAGQGHDWGVPGGIPGCDAGAVRVWLVRWLGESEGGGKG